MKKGTIIFWLIYLTLAGTLIYQWMDNWYWNPKPREYYKERGYFPD